MRLVTLRQFGISVALGSCLALGCGGEKSETPEAAPGSAAAPAGAAPGAPTAIPPVDDVWITELPANFPDDVPQYPGATVVKARPTFEEGIVVGFSTSDDPVKVANYFADALAAKGWSTNRVDAPEGIMLFADKGDRSATYGVATADGATQIDLLVIEMR
ncbi:MAG TPA: hypothetical protein VII72_00785 [Myxococcota bacterium]|jgi:hypothetical protein